MDTKHVRLLRLIDEMEDGNIIYVDESCLYSLRITEGEKAVVVGKRTVKDVEVRLLPKFDQDGYIARVGKNLLDKLYLEYGEEVLIHT